MSTRRAILIVAVVFCVSGWSMPVVADDAQVEQLVRLLGSEDFAEREQAGKKLIALGRSALPALKIACHSKDVEIARRARECMFQIDPSLEIKPQVLAWIKQLRSSDKDERSRASESLFMLGPKLKPFVPAVAEVLKDPDIEIRMTAVCLLRGAGSIAEKALPDLMSILKDKTPGTNTLRQQVLHGIEKMGHSGRPAIPIVLYILETEESEMQQYAMQFLSDSCGEDPRVGPALLKALTESKSLDVQHSAIWFLAHLQKESQTVVPVILQILKNHSFKGIKEENREGILITCLGEYGPLAESAIPYLVQVVKDAKNDKALRQEAIRILIRIGPAAIKVIPGLKDLREPIRADDLYEIARQLGRH